MAEQTIDKLQVEVEATAKGTSAVFRQLESQLSTLSRALSAIDTSKLDAVQKSVSKSKVGIDTSGISKAEKQVASGVAKIQQALAGLGAYANAAMGGDKSSLTSFDRRVTSIQSSIDTLQEKMKALGGTEVPTEAFLKLDAQIDSTSAKIKELEAEQDKMKKSGFDPATAQSAEWDSLSMKIAEAKDKIADLQEQQRQLTLSGEAISMPFEKFSAIIDELQGKLLEMSNNVHQASGANVKPDGLEETKEKADKATISLKDLFNSSRNAHKLSDALKKMKNELSKINDAAHKVAKKGFMSILKYGFGIRSIYVLFRRLRKAVVESFGELQNSGAFFETTRANVESLKESLTTLKYQFGAAFEPIFNAVAPAIKVFIDKLVEAMNAISAFMARLTGKSTYSKAVYNAAKFANNTGKAAKAQKELNKQLQGFDEINNLTTNNNNGGGSGSGSNSELPDAYYVEERVDNALGDWGKHLADLIKSGDWKAVGKTISTKLAESLESIKWDDIKRKAGNFGKNLADFLNGLIDPRLFGDIGKTIGEAINTGLTFFNEWGKGMDWENLGKSLASGFNEWLKAGNLPLLGETLHTWIAGGLDALITFLDEADFEELGKQLAEFIANLDIPDLVAKLAKLAVKILEALGEAIKSLWDNSDIKDKLVLAIVGILLALNFVGKLGGLATLILTGLASGFGTQGIAGAFGSMVGNSLAGQTVTATASGFSIKLAGVSLIMSGAMAIGSMAVGELEKNNIFDPNSTTRGHDIAVRGTQYGLGLSSLALGAGTLKYIFSGGASKILPSALGFGKSAALPLLADVVGAELGNQIGKDFFSTVLNDKEMASYYDDYRGFGNIFDIDTYRGLGEIFGAVKDGTLGKAWNELWGDVGEFFYDFHQENRQALKEWLGFSDGVEGAETSMKDAWDSASQRLFQTTNSYRGLNTEAVGLSNTTKTLTSRTKAFGDETKNSSNKFKQGINGLSAMAQNVFGEAYTKGTQKWSGIGSWASQKSNEVKNGVSNLPSNMSNTFSNAYSQSTSKWSGLGAWASSTLNKVPSETRAKLNQVPSLWSQSFTSATNQGKTPISQFQSWLQRVNLDKKASVKADETSFSNVKKNYNDLVNKLQNKTVTINVQANGFSAIGSQIQSLSNQLSSLKYASTYQNLGTTNYGVRKFATGGIVSGATRAIVGEAGPEAIIPLTDGTLGSLSKLIVGEMVKPQVAQISSPTYSAWGSGDSSVSEQNALLREEVALLRQIAGKELTISSSEVFKATQAESNNYYNRTGNSPFLF